MMPLYVTVKEVRHTTYLVDTQPLVDRVGSYFTSELINEINSDTPEEYSETVEPIEFIEYYTPEEWTQKNPERNL